MGVSMLNVNTNVYHTNLQICRLSVNQTIQWNVHFVGFLIN